MSDCFLLLVHRVFLQTAGHSSPIPFDLVRMSIPLLTSEANPKPQECSGGQKKHANRAKCRACYILDECFLVGMYIRLGLSQCSPYPIPNTPNTQHHLLRNTKKRCWTYPAITHAATTTRRKKKHPAGGPQHAIIEVGRQGHPLLASPAEPIRLNRVRTTAPREEGGGGGSPC